MEKKTATIGTKIKDLFSFSKSMDENSFISSQGVLFSNRKPNTTKTTTSPDNSTRESPNSSRRHKLQNFFHGSKPKPDEFDSIEDVQRTIKKFDETTKLDLNEKKKTLEMKYFHQIELDKKNKEKSQKMNRLIKQLEDINLTRKTKKMIDISTMGINSFEFLCEKFLQQLKEEIAYSEELEMKITDLNVKIDELIKKNQFDLTEIHQKEIQKMKNEVKQKTKEMIESVEISFEKEKQLRHDLIRKLEFQEEKYNNLVSRHAHEIEESIEIVEYVNNEVRKQQEKLRYFSDLVQNYESEIQDLNLEIKRHQEMHTLLEDENQNLVRRNEQLHHQLDVKIQYVHELETAMESQVQRLNMLDETVANMKEQHSNEVSQLETMLKTKDSQIQTLENILERKSITPQVNFEKIKEYHQLELDRIHKEHQEIQKSLEEQLIKEMDETAIKSQEYQEVIRNLNQVIQTLKTEKSNDQNLLKERDDEIQSLKDQVSDNQIMLVNKQKELNSQNNANLNLTELNISLEQENRLLKLELEKYSKISGDNHQQMINDQQQELEKYRQLLKEEYEIERDLRNKLMELNGNIQVICRIKPNSNNDAKSFIHLPKENDSKINILEKFNDISGRSSNTKIHSFTFNKVLPPKSTQQEVFSEVSNFVQSAMDGHNVCIFAYGQTGSGKTYTMMDNENPKIGHQGMIQQSIHKIFRELSSNSAMTFSIESSFIEIYKDKIYDLLNLDKDLKYEIKHENEKTKIVNLDCKKISSPEEFMGFLKIALKNRIKGMTKSNDRSSRSHMIIQLKITTKVDLLIETSEGLLNFVDLSGSERMVQTEGFEERSKETKFINKSLSCLGDVIHSISKKETFIPYRNSTLTYLLKNSLSKNSKVLMIVNISANENCLSESLNSLRFAKKANACELANLKK